MKPDLVAPGASVLTTFAQEDRTVESYGTSIAAPVVAGNAALVRQYFEEGWFPCDNNEESPSSNCNIIPSGSLVKAVLMNGAQPMKQVQVSRPWIGEGNELLEEVNEYDSNQGMGLIKMDSSLPIPGKNLLHAIMRNNQSLDNGEVHDIFIKSKPWQQCNNASYKYELSVTLAWYDPAGEIGCAKCLIDDFDLWVHKLNTRKGKWNHKVFANGGTHNDDRNNVERIRFQVQGNKAYRIRVKGSNLSANSAKFSLIATGCFEEIDDPTR